jgi:hypothetical protein
MSLQENFISEYLLKYPNHAPRALLECLISDNLIHLSEMKRFMIVNHYPPLQNKYGMHKAAVLLADRFQYHEKHISRIIRKSTNKKQHGTNNVLQNKNNTR